MSRIRLVAAMMSVLLVGAGCSGSGDDSATGTTPPSSPTTATTSTTSTTEVGLEWFGTAWADEPELTDAGASDRRALRYGLSGLALAQEAEAAVAADTPPAPPHCG